MRALCVSRGQITSKKDNTTTYDIAHFLYVQNYQNGSYRFHCTDNPIFGTFEVSHLYNLDIDLNGRVINSEDLGECQSIEFSSLLADLHN